LFNRHHENLAILKAPQVASTGIFLFFSLLVYLTSGVFEQPVIMLEQTSKNHSAVLKNIPTSSENNTNKGSSSH